MGRREREREIGEAMSKRSATPSAETTAVDDHAEPDFVALAKGLIPLADEHAEAAEERGALADEVVEALHATGLWAIWVPRPLGGAELAPVPSLEVIEHLSYADASTGWVVMAAALATGADAAFLGDEAIEALFGGERLLVHAGAGTQPGTAVPTDGGFLLSGSWRFASGVKHAQVVHTAGLVTTTGQARICVFGVDQATLIDNWDVLGLRATGSIDYTTDSLYVPEAYTYHATTETPLRGGILYTLGIINLGMICHSAWALGVGRRMLDELLKLIEAGGGRAASLGDNHPFQGEYAMAEAKLRAARAFVYETWHDVEETLDRGEPLSIRQNTLTRLALQHATWTIEEVSMFVYNAAGTTALRSGVIQRFFRDMHAGTQHMTSAPPVRQACGRQLAGLAPGKRWQFVTLVDPS
jgi:alkylation response protein AidB-like acyl-CoA dehydrogenase